MNSKSYAFIGGIVVLVGTLAVSLDAGGPQFKIDDKPINRRPVESAADAVELGRQLKGTVLLKVWSQGGTRYMPLELGS